MEWISNLKELGFGGVMLGGLMFIIYKLFMLFFNYVMTMQNNSNLLFQEQMEAFKALTKSILELESEVTRRHTQQTAESATNTKEILNELRSSTDKIITRLETRSRA